MSPLPRISPVVAMAALASAIVVAALGLQEFAFSDYQAEVLPAAQALGSGDVSLFLSRLPGYAGAVILQAPAGLLGGQVGGDTDLWTWRFQAIPGLLLLATLGAVLGSYVAARIPGLKGMAWGALTAVMVAGSPFAVRAETVGHPEELLVVGLAVGAVLLALRGRVVTAGFVVGLAAVAKPWAAVAIPIVLLAADDRRGLVRSVAAMAVAGAALSAPALFAHGVGGTAGLVPASSGEIFKPSQIFWFFGAENPASHASRAASDAGYAAAGAPYADRLAVGWAGRISHPLIVVVAFLVCLAYAKRPRAERRSPDLLLLLGAAMWWRCVLDTWNADYYALGALIALAAWSAVRARPPVLAVVATAALWVTFRGPAAWWELTPDLHTAIYLGWAVPFGLALSFRAVAPDHARRLTQSVAKRRPWAKRRVAADSRVPMGIA